MIFENVTITKNREIATGIWKMEFYAPEISSKYNGVGQFIQIQIESGWEYPLRRPMSIAGCNENTMSIIYKIFGTGTSILSKKIPGETINILGPLGNIFNLDSNHTRILVGGGVGLAPIVNLWNQFNGNTENTYLIIGARTKDEHIHAHEPDKHIYLTTDDGSLGTKGTVMITLVELCENERKIPEVFACGPEPMLKEVQSYVTRNSIPAQLAVESYMGCGVGICQGCVILRQNNNKKEHSYHEHYSLVCIDGPVYNAGDIIFD
jgi:dihydroorotate dehydrogenase electron transfer subunit